ncbi:MAG: S8 family serine peptidase [Phycisphaerae bacterium]|nr:S8 family serine peptidase [Phycisphaerae bacterium]
MMKTLKSYTHNSFCTIVSLLIFLSASSTVSALKEALGKDGINAYAVHEKGITGAGVNIGLLSNGNVRDSHIAFERENGSAVRLHDFTDSGLSRSSHDTEMAGIILSNGSSSHPDQIGGAPGAKLHSGRFSDKSLYQRTITNALDELIKKHYCRIIMTGIQLPKEIVSADGNSNWAKLYDYYAETYDVIFAVAAGNSSPQVTVFGDIYNGIAAAGMVKSDPNGIYDKIGSISNHGPTADGRKKPEVSAPTQGLVAPTSTGDDQWETLDPTGLGLTSYAIPHTVGVAALLLETAAKCPAENDDRTEVIKAVIINSADPVPFNTDTSLSNPADSTTVWNPDSGYGKLDALKAYETLTAGSVSQKTPTRQTKGWAYDVIGKTQMQEYQIQAAKNKRLIVTVTWHRKLQKIGSKYFEEPVPFRLDLKILSPAGKMLAFETAGPNNLIKADLLLREDGQYTVVLKNPTLAENRDYGLAFEVTEP